MKRILPLIFLTALVMGVPALASAAPNTVMVVFNGNTEVNRHVYQFLGQALGGSGFRVTATLDPSSVKPGLYKAVVVVSTKTSSGIDPTLEGFVKSYSAPQELYLVSLLSRTGSLSVTPFTAATGPDGVDGVTAATTWSGGSQAMHSQWMQVLVKAISAK